MARGIRDHADVGIFPLQDHEHGVNISTRLTMAGVRISSVPDPTESDSLIKYAAENDMGTIGDIHPWIFWQTADRNQRGMGSWAMAWAGMTSGGGSGGFPPGGGTGHSARPSSVSPFGQRFDGTQLAPDTRYTPKVPLWPCTFQTIPQGVMVMVMPTTREDDQQEVMLHADPRLFAVNTEGPDTAGTLVCDLQPNAEPCMDHSREPGVGGRHARLQSMIRVIAMPIEGGSGLEKLGVGRGNLLAWNCATSTQDELAGFGLCWAKLDRGTSGPITPRGPKGPTTPTGPTGPITQPPGSWGAEGAVGGGAQSPCEFGEFEEKPKEGFGSMLLANLGGSGPLHAGNVADKHNLGEDRDGNPINSGHISEHAFFYRDQKYDGPLLFEGDYPGAGESQVRVNVHLSWDDSLSHPFAGGSGKGKWRWWTTVPYMEPSDTGEPKDLPPPPWKPPSGPNTPGPTTPGPSGPTTPGPGGPIPDAPNGPLSPRGVQIPPPVLAPVHGVPGPITPPSTGPHPRGGLWRYPITRGPATPGRGPLTGPHGPKTPTDIGPLPPAPAVPPGPPGDRIRDPQHNPLRPVPGIDPRTGLPWEMEPQPPVPPNPWDDWRSHLKRLREADGGPGGDGGDPEILNLGRGRTPGLVGATADTDVALYTIHHPLMESFAEMAFRPQFMALGAYAFTHNPDVPMDVLYRDEYTRPQVVAMRTWGAQEDSGEWDYQTLPQDSRARGGIADGGILFTPADLELEDYFGIGSNASIYDAPSQSYVTCAPGTAFALGTPHSSGGLAAKSVIIGQFASAALNDKLIAYQLGSARAAVTLFDAELDQTTSEVIMRLGTGGNQCVQIPRGTIAQRPTAWADDGGMVRIVTDACVAADTLDYYDEQNSAWKQLGATERFFDGAILETIDIDVVDDGGTIKLQLQADGGGDLTCRFDGVSYVLDCTPVLEVALTAGTDTVPVQNFVFITEAAGSLTLTANTTGFPTTAHCPVATVVCQSAASLTTDGALKVHAWTDHVAETGVNGHLSHVNAKLRAFNATWISGVAPSDLVVDDPDAYISTTEGSVFQLHPHTMPALDMETPEPVYLVNDPTTAYKRITTFDDITQDASSGAINNKYMCLVLWGCISEDTGDCRLFINLPTGTYTVEAQATADSAATAVYSFPSFFVGCAFLIARYTVQAKDSGAWSQSAKADLRGILPSTAIGGSTGSAADHSLLFNLTADDHTHYTLVDGTRAFTGPQSFGTNNITSVGKQVIGHTAVETNASLWVRPSAAGGAATTADDFVVIEDAGDAFLNFIGGAAVSQGVVFSDGTRARGSIIYDHTAGATTEMLKVTVAGVSLVEAIAGEFAIKDKLSIDNGKVFEIGGVANQMGRNFITGTNEQLTGNVWQFKMASAATKGWQFLDDSSTDPVLEINSLNGDMWLSGDLVVTGSIDGDDITASGDVAAQSVDASVGYEVGSVPGLTDTVEVATIDELTIVGGIITGYTTL